MLQSHSSCGGGGCGNPRPTWPIHTRRTCSGLIVGTHRMRFHIFFAMEHPPVHKLCKSDSYVFKGHSATACSHSHANCFIKRGEVWAAGRWCWRKGGLVGGDQGSTLLFVHLRRFTFREPKIWSCYTTDSRPNFHLLHAPNIVIISSYSVQSIEFVWITILTLTTSAPLRNRNRTLDQTIM